MAALAVPSAMAYAEVAGMSPVIGLYALLLPTVAYVLLGSSRQLIVGPEGSISTLVAAAVLPLAVAASAGAAELGGDARAPRRHLLRSSRGCFGSAGSPTTSRVPVLIGYIHGVAVILVIGQLGKLLGLSIDAR